MARGVYDLGRREPALSDEAPQVPLTLAGEPVWRAELLQSQAFWYDLAFNPLDGSGSRQLYDAQVSALQALQDELAADSELCCIGFWAARAHVRFCLRKKPHYSLVGGEFVFYVELGRSRIRRKLSTTFVDVGTGMPVKPRIELNEREITIYLSDDEPETVSIYDFLRKCGLELGIGTQIYGVKPVHDLLACWRNGADSRLSEMLYRVSNEEHDFFFFCNLFRVTSVEQPDDGVKAGQPRRVDGVRRPESAPPRYADHTAAPAGGSSFAALGSTLWATKPEPIETWAQDSSAEEEALGSGGISMRGMDASEQGNLVAQALCTYFQIATPALEDEANEAREPVDDGQNRWDAMYGRRRETLRHRSGDSPSQACAVQVLLRLENPHELYRFGSETVAAADKHLFTCYIHGDQAELLES